MGRTYVPVPSSLRDLLFFHGLNMGVLVLLAFALTPSAELLRARLQRAKRNEHWKMVWEPPNRLEDSTAPFPMLGAVLIYLFSATLLTWLLMGLSERALAVLVLVAGMGICMAGFLLYLQTYSERSGFRAALMILALALVVPPVLVGVATQSAYNTVFVSPVMYLAYLGENLSHRLKDRQGLGEIWTCPLASLALGTLLLVLATMRIRFLLDMIELARRREAEKPSVAGKAEARALLPETPIAGASPPP